MQLFRLLSAQPQADGETFVIRGSWHTDDWYTDAYGQNPAPFYRDPFLSPPSRLPYPWKPNVAIWGADDALFPNRRGFGVVINAGNSPETLDISGAPPVNAPPAGDSPQVPLQATTANTGGTVLPGSYLFAVGSVGGATSQHFINVVVPAGTNTNRVTISGVVWTAAAPGAIRLYVGENALTMRKAVSWTGSSNDGFGNPTVFSITAIDPDGYGMPDIVFDNLLFQAKEIIHGGDWGSAPSSTGVASMHATATFAGATWSTDQWAGYTLSLYSGDSGTVVHGHLQVAAATRNWVVISNTADTLTFDDIFGPGPGDVVVMRAAATHISANTIGDDNFENSFNGGIGLTVDAEKGNMLRIIAGTGLGQPEIPIASNTSTVLTLVRDWYVTPDSSTVYIIVAPQWRYFQSTGTLTTYVDSPGTIQGSIPLNNFQSGSLLVQAISRNANNNWSVDTFAPIRELYVPAVSLASGVTIAGDPVLY